MTTPLVLVVDDEPMVREVLSRYLDRDGFRVLAAQDGEEAVRLYRDHGPDLVLLDLMLPKLDGLEVFRRMRQGAMTPVIMLTARGEETDRVVGLDLGADDYVTKPFSPREVVARVRSVLRRSSGGAALPNSGLLAFGVCSLDAGKRALVRAGEPVGLTRREFDLLLYMASQPGMTFSRTQLLEEVWDFAWDGDTSTVTVHVRRLREKIEPDPANPSHLITVWGVGYRFER
ncbi:MAG: response regulator transcription factor [Actinomycetota bacterium]